MRLAAVVDPAQPGLPRGRSSLPTAIVQDAQRDRLLRAVMSAVAEKGYGAVTVADIVASARVSRSVFYEHFADKQQCFLAAAIRGGAEMTSRLTEVAGAAVEPGNESGRLRASVRAYLDLCVEEPEFTRCLFLEFPTLGPEALALRSTALRYLAELLRDWHTTIQDLQPDQPAVPRWSYQAAIGAAYELLLETVRVDGTSELTNLEEPVTDVITRMLSIPAQISIDPSET